MHDFTFTTQRLLRFSAHFLLFSVAAVWIVIGLPIYSANQSNSVQLSSDNIEDEKNQNAFSQSSANSQFATNSIRKISITANDIVYNPADKMIYASVPGNAGNTGNSITRIEPRSGAIGESVYVGSEPNKLALSDDGSTIYVSLDGAGAIRRYDTATQIANLQFAIRGNSLGYCRAYDLAVAPGNPDLIAASRYCGSANPSESIAVFNNGVQRPNTVPSIAYESNVLAFSASANTLYSSRYEGRLRTLAIDQNGVKEVSTTPVNSVGARIKFDNGKIFTSNGEVINAETGVLLGTFANVFSYAFVVDASVGRAYYLVQDDFPYTRTIKAFDINTFTPVGSYTLPHFSGGPINLLRWGANGLAFQTSENELYLIQTSLIPSNEPIPSPTSTVSPTPTPTATPFAASIKQIQLATNDLLFNPATQKIQVSIPGIAGNNGNSVAAIDPVSATVGDSIFVGSDPNKLALSDDGKTLYVGLDGAGAVRRVDLASQTAGLQFSLGNDGYNGPRAANYIEVMPGNSSTVAVSRNHFRVAIYDNGVERPQTAGEGAIKFASPTRLFCHIGGGIIKTDVNTTGVSSISTFSTNASYSSNVAGDFHVENGIIYTFGGGVVDGESENALGRFGGDVYLGSPTVDTAKGKVFFLTGSSGNYVIRSYDLATFRPLGSLNISGINGEPSRLIRWGENGLAFRTNQNQIFLIQTTLVDANSVVPVATPTPSPTATPSPTPEAATFVKRIDLPVNDLVYNKINGALYVSVPSIVGPSRGNTITRINPQTGTIESSVFIGSEPNKLALSDDGQILHAHLSGANAIRPYNIATDTLGEQFSIGQNRVTDMEAVPGKPHSVAVAGNLLGNLAIYDNGVRRADTGSGTSVGIIEFGDSPSTIYGYDTEWSSSYNFVRFAADGSGVRRTHVTTNLLTPPMVEMKYADGRIYATNGQVVDPESRQKIGTFAGMNYTVYSNTGTAIAVDSQLGRAFVLINGNLSVYDTKTFLKIGSVKIPNFEDGTILDVVRWGTNGLAFRTGSTSNPTNLGNRLYIVQSALVSSTSPIPTGFRYNWDAYTGSESNQSINITVNRTGDLSQPMSVNYATSDGTATAGLDYTAASGTLSFAPGENTKSFSVRILNDNIYEGNETFNLSLTNPTGGSTIEIPGASVVTINDDDYRPSMYSNDFLWVDEPFSGTVSANVTFRLTNPTTQTITIDYYTSNGTATVGSDYIAASGSLTFNPLETEKTISIIIKGDNIPEPDENFYLNFSNNINDYPINGRLTINIRNFNPATARRIPFDFDGDARSDISVFRPAGGNWYILQSSSNTMIGTKFGQSGDIIAPADFEGDGRADISVFRNGYWYRLNSSDGQFVAAHFGQAGDIPIPGDFDGDGKADYCVFRPSNGHWYRLNSSNGQFVAIQFGISEDKPILGDFDGDRKADLAVFRPSNGSWYILRSLTNSFFGQQFGSANDKAVAADFDGDGRTDISVFRPSDGAWYRINSSNRQFVGVQFGQNGDLPVAGDYDADARADIAVFRPSDGGWYLLRSTKGYTGLQFGIQEDIASPSAFVW